MHDDVDEHARLRQVELGRIVLEDIVPSTRQFISPLVLLVYNSGSNSYNTHTCPRTLPLITLANPPVAKIGKTRIRIHRITHVVVQSGVFPAY